MKYKVGDKFVWKEGRCCIDFYKNDEYELRYDEKKQYVFTCNSLFRL